MHLEIRGMEKLSFRERQVVVLKETGHPTEEIAKQLNLSASTVSTLINRAKSKGYQIVMVIPSEKIGLDMGGEE
ncbi:MAG: sigma factor-like helix-turn-helix DNA-binding protein [Peptococcaceae bacterium]|nr:sigma factor-like helix-turn-helix DNA-binding protein [Peptococcaceae bacterium]